MVWPKTLRELISDIKEWRRGHVRVLPGMRGRVYAKRGEIDSRPGHVATEFEVVGELQVSRIWKESEKKWYTLDEYRKTFGNGG